MAEENGLKQQWGVQDPAKVGTGQQAQQFQVAFQREMAAVSGHLQYTAANAELASHEPLATRRDGLYPSFQAALAQIDPTNPGIAQRAIDQVLASAKMLQGETAALRKRAEKARNDWQMRSSSFETAVVQIEELEGWEHAKAGALRSLVDGIRKLTDERKFAPASSAVDLLLPKLKPIHLDYLRQKEAQKGYQSLMDRLSSRLNDAASSRYLKLQPMQEDMDAIRAKMELAAKAKDFVQALQIATDLGSKLDTYEKALSELDASRKSYEDALNSIQPRLTNACLPHPKLELLQKDLLAVQDQMAAAAQVEDFKRALEFVKDVSTKLDAFAAALTELERQKKAYDDALAPLRPRLDKVCQSESPALAPLQEELIKIQEAMDLSAKSENYDQALILAKNLSANLDAYESSKEGQVYKITYEGKEYFGTSAELAGLRLAISLGIVKNGLGPLRLRAEASEGMYRELKSLADSYFIISTVVNAIGGASFGPIVSAIAAQKKALDTAEQAVSGDPKRAEAAFTQAVSAVNATGASISAYLDAIDSGGKATITALQVVEYTCFAVAAAAGAAVLAPAGAGLAATAGANAVSGAGFAALQSVAESGAHNLILSGEKPISAGEIVSRAAVAAVLNGAGAALGAVASKALGAMVVEKIVARLGVTQAASKLAIKDFVEGSLSNSVQAVVSGTPDLISGKTTWDQFAVNVAQNFIAGGIGQAIAGRIARREPLFKNLTDEELEAAFKEMKGGTALELPGQNPRTGEGLVGTETRFDPNAKIPHHDNMTFEGIDGAPAGKQVEVRRHSANPNAPEGSYSRDNPTTQIDAISPPGPSETPAMLKKRLKNQEYRLPDGTYKKFSQMTDAEKKAAHIH